MNQEHSINALGKVTGFFDKISFEKFEILSKRDKIEIPICDLDFAAGRYKVNCILFDKKHAKVGKMKIISNAEEFNFEFKSLQINRFMKLFNYPTLDSELDGNLQLKSKNGIFVGDGIVNFSNFMSPKNLLSIDLKILDNGVKIAANLKNKTDKMIVDAFLPFFIRVDGTIFRNTDGNSLNCHVHGNAHLEKMLELSDDSDVRGLFSCDFKITGNFANPLINGYAQLQNPNIAVGGVVLKNGNVLLRGDGKIIYVSDAKFIDDYKKKLSIAGSGKLFFNGIIPNINTNLHLTFDNFTLFNSESIKIKVRGSGSMTGPINDMVIAGNIDIPKCELDCFDTSEARQNEDIVVENDIFLNPIKKKDIPPEKDFFKYNVSMHCPKIIFLGNIFEICFAGNLLLSTYSGKATLVGELKLTNGRLDLFGKRMLFTKGYANFIEKFPFDPDAFLVCTRNLGDIGVILNIKNTPNKGSSLELLSTPNYTKDVILSKMIFGKELKYLSIGEIAQLANAVASFQQKGYIFLVLNTFQKIGIVDSISFTNDSEASNPLYSNTQNSHNSHKVNMSAGKYVHDNLFISVNKKQEETTFDVDFSLTPKISIKANTNGEAGVSWKHRY
jgi:autotransporter translocation and assembly factor TamB